SWDPCFPRRIAIGCSLTCLGGCFWVLKSPSTTTFLGRPHSQDHHIPRTTTFLGPPHS
ncbi:hypothetical protein K469DRAFT_781503, partial [Zopfia rhizophila CBS 207.26]